MTWPEAFAFVGVFASFFAFIAFYLYTEMRATKARCRMAEKLSEPQTYIYEETMHE